MRKAKGDCDKLKERVEEEESLVTLDELEQIHTEGNEMISSDKQKLIENRHHSSSEIERIGELSVFYIKYVCNYTISMHR